VVVVGRTLPGVMDPRADADVTGRLPVTIYVQDA
jgi:hypothetical protein